jgi:hypothetical protein
MNAPELLKANTRMGVFVVELYLKDLNEDDLFVRPHPRANHVAWQLGHVISSTQKLLIALNHQPPTLPQTFEQRHAKEMAASDERDVFSVKAEYLSLLHAQRDSIIGWLEQCTESDLNGPAPDSMKSYAPTIGAAILSFGNHLLMHSGQIAVLRKILGKPVVM